jgi:protein CpxP
MKLFSKYALLIVGTVLVVGTFSACSHHRDPEHRAQWMQEKVTKELELNDVQQVNLKRLSDEILTARKAMKTQFGDDRDQLLVVLDQPTMDRETVLGMIQSHTRAIDERAPAIVVAVGDFYDSLNAQQQVEIRDFIQQHSAAERHRGGH